MAPHERNDSATPRAGRRDVLRAGAIALGAALLPKPAAAVNPEPGMLERLRQDYARRVEALAERLRPRFESGELHGFREYDGDRMDRAWCERRGEPFDPEYRPPAWRIEEEVRAADVVDFPTAYLVLACSPSEELMDGGTALSDVEGVASMAMAYDVIRVARRRGWYAPTPDEEPGT